jgi:hypothetical protein
MIDGMCAIATRFSHDGLGRLPNVKDGMAATPSEGTAPNEGSGKCVEITQ